MASDSRVSGSEDARTPDDNKKGSDGAPDPKTTPQAPESMSPESADPADAQRPATQPTKSQKASTQKASTQRGPAADARPVTTAATGNATGTPPADDPAAKNPVAKDAVAKDAVAKNGAAEETAEDEGERTSFFSGNRFLMFNAVPSWMVSMMVHAVLLMILALLTLPERPPEQRIVAVANPNNVEDVEDLENEEIEALDVEVFEGLAPSDLIDKRESTAELDIPSLDDSSAAPEQIKLEGFGDMVAPSDALMDRIGGGEGVGLGEARGAKARRGQVDKYGGSAGSEAAVAAALKWLAEHQMRDGGWHFDHTMGPCKGRCPNPGQLPPARNGATAMALLPFLGAGQTHMEGQYKQTVESGLAFLVRSMKAGNGMGDLSDSGGRLYSHGLASIALCEAYAMTNDSGLLQPAQLSLNFIVYAQDSIGGGWRYTPHQAGDTSVLGWQLMACKSGSMAYLQVPNKTIMGASRFLDFVQEDNGAKYGYTVPAQGPATTAVGLLCRMYLGWKHDNPSLKAGVEYLHQMGPTDNMYYNYYATQVMRHYGGQFWETWNGKLRDRLVESQDTKNHAKGSWYFPKDPWADKGGRLYSTSMATMMLEVYYRHMPIYGKQAAEEEFPL